MIMLQAGVKFQSPHDGSEMVLSPEHSVQIQNTIGRTIIEIGLYTVSFLDRILLGVFF